MKPQLIQAAVVAVSILLLTACGGASSDTDDDNIDNNPPVARVRAPSVAEVGRPILIDASHSSDEDGFIAEYWFEPGDETPTLQSASPEIFHTYLEAGSHTVTVHVIDNLGAKDTERAEVRVR